MNNIKKAIEELKRWNGEGNMVILQKEDEEIIKTAISALAKQLVTNKTFEWHKCKRKNGTEFLKLVWYSNEADGWVEAGRFDISKSEFVQNNWTLDDIYRELQ